MYCKGVDVVFRPQSFEHINPQKAQDGNETKGGLTLTLTFILVAT